MIDTMYKKAQITDKLLALVKEYRGKAMTAEAVRLAMANFISNITEDAHEEYELTQYLHDVYSLISFN